MVVWSYIEERIDRFNQAKTQRDRDDLLYRIGSHADVLDLEDVRIIRDNDGGLHPEQRFEVLQWMIYSANAEVEGNLVLLIFGQQQLQQWYQQAKAAYPDFEMMLGARTALGTEDYLELSLHFQPQAGAPQIDPELDFPWKPFWDAGEMFWGHFPENCSNEFEFILHCYPRQASFTIPNSEMEDWELESEDGPDLFLIRELLGLPELSQAR
ncbi:MULTISPECIES: hypothetical protein [Trichocoleus]|uniref:Uncharacterized protein n=1 Tax=Trichocoleus desertorum GB2-A4 TaxID=2933944 RepID=A0ABV0JFD6_9CYAN|nr:hypothetical protein [Trichocoleus sp. FACHB-46]MBD1864539.1 hypothetical protein [Trichocoleus sp. FACHB-46]